MKFVGGALLSLLSQDWAGLVLAALLALIGWALGGAPGLVVLSLAGMAGLLALIHVIHAFWIAARFPPPGQMVSTTAGRLHVVSEGAQNGKPAFVVFAGAHASGAAIHHLHRAMSAVTRSILIDRPGTGWSGPARFPLSTASEAQAVLEALRALGEPGPFIFAGHSFGGLLAANIARRGKDVTAALVLLDPTPPDTIVYGPRLGAHLMRRMALLRGILALFAIYPNPNGPAANRDPILKKMIADSRALIGAFARPMEALNKRARSAFADFSIYNELSPEGMAAAGWNTVVYEHELDGMPVHLIAPGDAPELEVAANALMGSGTTDAKRMVSLIQRTRERFMAVSDRAKRVIAPAGTGHNFPFEAPDWLIGELKAIILSAPQS
jgi:pimeloyl-ACP methyl ester carboxylesterase